MIRPCRASRNPSRSPADVWSASDAMPDMLPARVLLYSRYRWQRPIIDARIAMGASMSDEQPTVVVIGGGYGGVTVAKALDDVARVVLVEPKDAFQHNVAALRAVVAPEWTARTFLPYDRLMTRGTVIRDRAVEVDQHGAVLGSGQRLNADYLV